jgi:hypothetical protein
MAMERQGEEVHFETDEARGASTPNIVRWVLAISLFAAIALLSVIWITGAAIQGGDERSGNTRTRVLEEYGARGGILSGSAGATNGTVGDDADRLEAAEPGDTAMPGTPPTVENEAADEPPPATEPDAN